MPEYDVAFVDTIVASPTVRLDLHSASGGWACLADGTEFRAPELSRVVADSQLADGGVVPSAAYRNRTITLALELSMSLAADTAATFVQALAREIDRPGGNILRYRPDTSTPVFFRTFRSSFDAVDWDPFMRRARLTLLAEPFAYGLEEVLSSSTVTNDPAAGSNGLFFDITSPKGDVETPLFLMVDAGVVGTGRRRSAFAVRRRGTVSATPLFLQAEAMTLGSNVTLPGNDAAMSGSGSNYARISYSVDVNMVPRLATNTKFPTSGSVDARGTYRVYARIRQPSGTGATVHQMRIAWGGADVQVVNDTVTLPVDTGPGAPTIKMIDLGLVQIPFGFDPVDKGISGVEQAVEGIYLRVDTGRVSGSGTTLDVDYLMFLPADDKVELIMWPGTATVNDFQVEGGPSPAVYARNASAQITSTEAVQIAGTGLMITPGRTNRIFFHRDVGTGTSVAGFGDSVTATTAIYPSYFPRYLFPLRPVST